MDDDEEAGEPQQQQQQQEQQFNFKPGTIKSLKLINFMCHESFELNLGSRVNFIIGPNGSGKSALLTALVVVLGGRATTTNRAKRLNEFIMYGKQQARIICTLHNYSKVMEKDKAFRPEEYGKEIIIEKTIRKDDPSAKLVLKNSQSKRVSERKQELDDILDHFSILINNPICILNQEISKTFLHSKKAEDKYELFMKATSLEQIKNDYDDAREKHREWGDCNERKAASFRVLDAELTRTNEKISFLHNRGKLRQIQDKLMHEVYYATVRDFEVKIGEYEKKINETIERIETDKTGIVKRESKISTAQLNCDQMKEKLVSCKEEFDVSKKKASDIRSRENHVKLKKIDLRGKIHALENELQRLKRGKESLEKSIAEEKKKFEELNALNQDTERSKLEIEQLSREVPAERARERTITQHTGQLGQSMTETRSEFHKANQKVSELTNEISFKEAHLRRLRGGQESELRKYGDSMVRLHEEIKLAHSEKRFKLKPYGPLGYYIKLRSEDAAAALESHLGRNSYAFICDNLADMQALNCIIRRLRASDPGFREPVIITRSYCSRHDTNRYKAQHEHFKTLLDYVDIEEDAVFNAIVDRTFLESVLFIPDYTDAENLMITQSLIPKGTRMAYTKDCHVMHPRTEKSGYKSIAPGHSNFCLFSKGNAEQIRQLEKSIEILEADLRDAKHISSRFQDNLNAQRIEFESNNRELRKIRDLIRGKEKQLLNLRTTLTTARPEQLLAFEHELEDFLKKIDLTKMRLDEEKKSLDAVELELKDFECEHESAIRICKKREESLRVVEKMIENEKGLIRKHTSEIDQTKTLIKSLERELTRMRETMDNSMAAKHAAESNPPANLTDRPRNLRSIAQIEEEKRKIDRQLATDLEENTNTDELLESLTKRKSEIESLFGSNEFNTDNFNKSKQCLSDRDQGFGNLKSTTVGKVSATFISVMRAMGMNGSLSIHDQDKFNSNGDLIAKARTLEMSIDTTPTQQRPSQQTGLLAMSSNNNSSGGGDHLAINGFNSGDNFGQVAAASSRARRRSATAAAQSQPNISLGSSNGPRQAKRSRLEDHHRDPTTPSTLINNTNVQQEKENMLGRMDTRSLSGGERSFSTVAFVLALWHHCSSPFKLMDEIDVFMDMVTRRMSYNALINFSKITDNSGQFIFFSPLELPKFEADANLVRVFEMPRIIRRGFCSQIETTSTGNRHSTFPIAEPGQQQQQKHQHTASAS